MEIQVKSREALYCNLKLFLLFLVVFGHLVEPCIWENEILYEIYRGIYCLHMPVFVFLSGLFVKTKQSALSQGKRCLFWYMLWQGLYAAAMFLLGRTWSFTKPYWHLWYLLSMFWWCFMAAGYYQLAEKVRGLNASKGKCFVVLTAVMIGLLAGGVSRIGREYSLSRTLVFAPYFLAGMFCQVQTEWRKYRLVGLSLFCFGLFLYWMMRDSITVTFLYQASGYGSLKSETGAFLRLICYLLGACGCVSLISWMPNRRFICTKAGADTMMMYVLHGPVVRFLWKLADLGSWYAWACPFLAGWILYGWYKIFQWHQPLFRIKSRKVPEYGGI